MKSLVLALVCLGLASSAHAQQRENDADILRGFDLKNDADRKLLAFCTKALLRERGLACSPFAGSTDKWIVKQLVPKREFLEALDRAPADPVFNQPLTPQSAETPPNDDKILIHYQRADKYTEKLSAELSVEQRKKLPVVYLEIEGLMALCRPEFAALIDRKELRDRICDLADEAWSKEAAEVHRAIFGLTSHDEAPLLEVELRRIAYRLDCRIAQMLNTDEKKSLVEVLRGSQRMRQVVYGALAY